MFCLRNFKAWWQGTEVKFSDGESDIEFAPRVGAFVFFPIIQSVLQSAPMFILQLYVMNVQHEPVTIIQMISLTLSLLIIHRQLFVAMNPVIYRNENPCFETQVSTLYNALLSHGQSVICHCLLCSQLPVLDFYRFVVPCYRPGPHKLVYV